MTNINQGTEVPNLRDETLEKVVWFDPEELDFYSPNESDHSDAEIDQFQRTIYEFNGALPIIVGDGGVIVAGRGRVEAGYLLGVDGVPALMLSDMTADDVCHYVETLTRFATYVGWSRKMLEIDLQSLISIDALLKTAAPKAAKQRH